MDRKEILCNIIENSEIHSLRVLIANSKTLQQTAFKGFRPQNLSKKDISRYLLRPAYINDDGIYERFCDWWRNKNKELVDGLLGQTEIKWESLINRWSAAKVRLAIVLSKIEDKDGILAEFSKIALKEIINAGNQTIATSDTIKQPNYQEIAKLRLKIDRLERRLEEVGRKNKAFSEQRKTLEAELNLERSKFKKNIESHKEMIEKVRMLEKTNGDLARQVKLLRSEAAARLTDLKVLTVDYLDFGDNLNERKSSLSLFYDLLCSPDGTIVKIENRQSKWLEKENIKAFWKKDGNKVSVVCRPADYLLVNIVAFLEDYLND